LRPVITTLGAAVIALAALTPSLAQSDMLGVPGPLSFQNEDYVLAWSSEASETYVKQEYVPSGQAVESFEDMILVEAVSGSMSPMDAAAAQIKMLEGRKGSDPVVNYDVMQNEGTGEVLLDFVLSDLSADPVVVEWSAYRYQELKDGEGVALMGISRRGYGQDGATEFMGGLGAMRSAAIAALAAFPFPEISIGR
jgi:hypothetical protein